jgi:hypothetical protein
MSNLYIHPYIMSSTHLPKYFALRVSDGFKLFTSCIFRSHQDINILSSLEYRTIYFTSSVSKPKTTYSSITRKWYGGDTVLVNWTNEGSEVAISYSGDSVIKYIPVIIFIKCTHGILPSGVHIQIPRSSVVHHKDTEDIYEDPEIYDTDPFLSNTSPSAVVSVTLPGRLPKHVTAILIDHCIRQKDTCPISGEDIVAEKASVTSCGHVFDTASISRWLSSSESRSLCPSCKQACVL